MKTFLPLAAHDLWATKPLTYKNVTNIGVDCKKPQLIFDSTRTLVGRFHTQEGSNCTPGVCRFWTLMSLIQLYSADRTSGGTDSSVTLKIVDESSGAEFRGLNIICVISFSLSVLCMY